MPSSSTPDPAETAVQLSFLKHCGIDLEYVDAQSYDLGDADEKCAVEVMLLTSQAWMQGGDCLEEDRLSLRWAVAAEAGGRRLSYLKKPSIVSDLVEVLRECERQNIRLLRREAIAGDIDYESPGAVGLNGRQDLAPPDYFAELWKAAGRWDPQPEADLWFNANRALRLDMPEVPDLRFRPPVGHDFFGSDPELGQGGGIRIDVMTGGWWHDDPNLLVERLNLALRNHGQLRKHVDKAAVNTHDVCVLALVIDSGWDPGLVRLFEQGQLFERATPTDTLNLGVDGQLIVWVQGTASAGPVLCYRHPVGHWFRPAGGFASLAHGD